MAPPDRSVRHRRETQILVGVALAFFFIWGGIYLSQQGASPFAGGTLVSRLPLFVLWYLDVVLIAATLFVIFRALIKLILERRRGVLGAKFKTKLLVTQLGLTAIPIALLFLAATNLLQRSIDRWFSTPVETIVNRSEALRDVADRRLADSASREARALARSLDASPAADPAAVLASDLRLRDFSGLELYPEGGAPVRLAGDGVTLPAPAPPASLEEARSRGEARWIDFLHDGSRWFRSAARSGRGVVVAGLRVPPVEAAAGDFVAGAWSDYRKLEVQRSAIKATNILVFTLLTLALLFAAIWTGLTLARRITAPIGALAESTRKITQGDLTAEVDVPASDELGVLVESFNTMTAEIRETRRRLETARTGIVALDRAGQVQVANPAALEILGLETVPSSLDALQDRAELAPLFEALAAARAGANPAFRVLSPAPSRRAEIEVAAMPAEEGGSRGFVIALEDTTEVARAQRLEAWTEAARRVAHEIKNPLTPIRLSAERMMRKIRSGDPAAPEAVRQGAEVIIEEVDLLKALVDQFSKFSRMPESRPEDTDLSALVEKTVSLYREAKDGVGIRLEDRLPRRTYRLDAPQVQRVLVNLLDNALEACDPGGSIVLALAERGGILTIAVSDTGSGIGPEDREKIFLPDFSTKPGGAGLGLAIVSRIVADHRGTIRWEENRPRGSRFVIEIPAA